MTFDEFKQNHVETFWWRGKCYAEYVDYDTDECIPHFSTSGDSEIEAIDNLWEYLVDEHNF